MPRYCWYAMNATVTSSWAEKSKPAALCVTAPFLNRDGRSRTAAIPATAPNHNHGPNPPFCHMLTGQRQFATTLRASTIVERKNQRLPSSR